MAPVKSVFGAVMDGLLVPERNMELGPGEPNLAVQERLAALDIADLAPDRRIRDPEMARGCLAGLWLYHNFHDESHAISQGMPSSTGSYWHGILHRREPDAGNAGYWFRKVKQHPVFAELASAAREAAGAEFAERVPGVWDPFAFIDWCEEVRGSGSPAEDACRRIQMCEFHLLMRHTFDRY